MSTPPELLYPCSHGDYKTTILGSQLYVLGGEEMGAQDDSIASSHLRIFDFSSPFNLDTESIARAVRLPDDMPRTSQGVLWGATTPDGKYIRTWGGFKTEYPTLVRDTDDPKYIDYQDMPNVTGSTVWEYDIEKGNWKEIQGITVEGQGEEEMLPLASPVFAADELNGSVYMQGGLFYGNRSVEEVLYDPGSRDPRLQFLTLGSTATRATNQTTADSQWPLGELVGGQMLYIGGFGEEGILVFLGGAETEGTGMISPGISMETVYIYDIKSKKWLKQETTAGGRGPEPRVHFCAVVASSQDKSSHNIYVTHEVGIDATTAETIHVLSIPSFQWVTVPNPLVTFGTNCHRLGERYMVAFGRIMTFDLDAEPRCMQATDKGQVNIFDLSELVWTRKLDNHPDELPYEVPEQVFKVIGGGPHGAATVLAPLEGFANEALEAIFTTPSHNNSTNITNDTEGTLNTNALIGGLVGGFGFLILAFIGYRLYFKRQHRNGGGF